MIQNLKGVFTPIEVAFNVVDCVPFLGVVSGSWRFSAGKVQALVGGGLLVFGGIAQCVSRDKKWEAVTLLGAEHVIHGLLNMTRGLGTVLLGTSTAGLGNILLLIPNMAKNQRFKPFFEYGALTERKQQLRLPVN